MFFFESVCSCTITCFNIWNGARNTPLNQLSNLSRKKRWQKCSNIKCSSKQPFQPVTRDFKVRLTTTVSATFGWKRKGVQLGPLFLRRIYAFFGSKQVIMIEGLFCVLVNILLSSVSRCSEWLLSCRWLIRCWTAKLCVREMELTVPFQTVNQV